MNAPARIGQRTAQSRLTTALDDYRFASFRRMLSRPYLVKQAILGTECTDWSGEVWLPTDDGGEDLAELEYLARDKLDRTDLTKLERADVEAALSALFDFAQRRMAVEDR